MNVEFSMEEVTLQPRQDHHWHIRGVYDPFRKITHIDHQLARFKKSDRRPVVQALAVGPGAVGDPSPTWPTSFICQQLLLLEVELYGREVDVPHFGTSAEARCSGIDGASVLERPHGCRRNNRNVFGISELDSCRPALGPAAAPEALLFAPGASPRRSPRIREPRSAKWAHFLSAEVHSNFNADAINGASLLPPRGACMPKLKNCKIATGHSNVKEHLRNISTTQNISTTTNETRNKNDVESN